MEAHHFSDGYFTFDYDGENLYVSATKSLFYSNQKSFFSEIKEILKYRKDPTITEIIVEKQGLLSLLSFLKSLSLSPSPVYNSSFLDFSYERQYKGEIYWVKLIGRKKTWDMIRRGYNMYELQINAEMLNQMIDEIKYILGEKK